MPRDRDLRARTRGGGGRVKEERKTRARVGEQTRSILDAPTSAVQSCLVSLRQRRLRPAQMAGVGNDDDPAAVPVGGMSGSALLRAQEVQAGGMAGLASMAVASVRVASCPPVACGARAK